MRLADYDWYVQYKNEKGNVQRTGPFDFVTAHAEAERIGGKILQVPKNKERSTNWYFIGKLLNAVTRILGG